MSKKLPPPPRSSSSSASAATAGASTYELQQAQSHASSQSDPISWLSAKSYRRCPYRQLHHQNDTIGTFRVRLLEAQNLTRSHWSVLGMGPVRHLGLSRAHGEVSSYVELSLGWSSSNVKQDKSASSGGSSAGDAASAAASKEPGPNVDAWRRSSSSAVVISEVNSRESEDSEDHEDQLDRKPAALPLDQLDQHQQQKPDLMSMSLRDAASRQQKLQSVETEWNSGLGGEKKASSSENEDENSGQPSADDTSNTHVESMHDLGPSNVHSNSHASQSESINRASHVHRSSTVHRNSNPTWPTSQRNGNRSLFAIRLHKRKHRSTTNGDDGGGEDGGGGSSSPSNTDGQRIQLHIVVKEEMTGVENALPDPFGLGLTKGGGAGSRGGTIGWATVDVTDLALGGLLDAENGKENRRSDDGNVMSGGAGASPSRGGVIDAWADLTLPIDDSHTGVARAAAAFSSSDDSTQPIRPKHKCTGRVRVLVSYEPNGMEPRRGDIAALECFARRNPSTSSCRILLPPLSPLRVLDVVGSYCLVEYDLPSSNVEALTARDRKKQLAQNGHDDRQDQRNNRGGDNSSSRKTGRARIHRNSIFVIERTNAVDGAVNLALAPVDAYLSTPLGRATSQIAGPLLDAAGELVAPAMLTGRLMLASANTVGAIGLNSAGAIVSTVAKNLDSNNEQTLDDRDPLSKV